MSGYVKLIMPRCTCTSEVYGSVCVDCVDLQNNSSSRVMFCLLGMPFQKNT